MNIVTLILFLISLGVLIFIHELGHFIAAKAFKVYVKEFSLGFGPLLFKVKKGETQYSVRALPLGGYVAMVGEETNDLDASIPNERSLLGIKKYQRALIMSAGIVLNFILAYVLFFTANFAFEQKEFRHDMTIMAGSPAATAGLVSSAENDRVLVDIEALKAGDIVVTLSATSDIYYLDFVKFKSYDDELIDGLVIFKTVAEERVLYEPTTIGETASFPLPIITFDDANTEIKSNTVITITAIAEGDAITFEPLGISLLLRTFRYSFFEALAAAGTQWVDGTTLIARAIGGLFVGQGLNEVGGIIAIFDTSATVFTNLGLGPYIYMWGLISVNLALFNLLPFPGLDGWQLLVVAIEGATRKEIPSKVKNIVSLVGLIILFGLMLLLIVKDIFMLF